MNDSNALTTLLGPVAFGVFSVLFVIGLGVSRYRRRRKESATPWVTNSPPTPGDASSVPTEELEGLRNTLGLKLKVDEQAQREHARQVIAKSRWRRLFEK